MVESSPLVLRFSEVRAFFDGPLVNDLVDEGLRNPTARLDVSHILEPNSIVGGQEDLVVSKLAKKQFGESNGMSGVDTRENVVKDQKIKARSLLAVPATKS